MKNCFGFLLVFDITQELTLQELTKFVEQIKRIKEAQEEPLDFPCVIVGNKCDLNYKLTEKEIYSFIKNNLELSNAVPLFLTSAKNRVNIDETFEALVKEMRKKRRAMEINKNGKSGSGNGSGSGSGSGGWFSSSGTGDKESDLNAIKETL